jgi:hypothetical protein
MERNPTNDPIGTGGSAGAGMGAGASTLGTGTDSLGVTGQGADQSATSSGTAPGASGAEEWSASQVGDAGGSGSPGLADRFNQAKSAASDRLGQVREKAGELKSTLADKLEAGATSLRNQGGGAGAGTPQLAGAGATATATTSSDPMARLAGPAADAMERTAQFLREGDLKATIENQVRTNPARTLLIAVGVGYLLGKALRGRDH